MEEIVKIINKLSGKYANTIIFDDWIKMIAIAITNSTDVFHDDLWKKREEDYSSIAKKYDKNENRELIRAFAILVNCFEEDIKDYLGEIYMKCQMGNSKTGQFFTPFHLAKAMSDLSTNIEEIKKSNKRYVVNEPSTRWRR